MYSKSITAIDAFLIEDLCHSYSPQAKLKIQYNDLLSNKKQLEIEHSRAPIYSVSKFGYVTSVEARCSRTSNLSPEF